jgi:large subunit ribosomal protein L24
MVAKKLRALLIVTPQEVVFEGVTAAMSGGALSADGSFRAGPGGLSVRGRLSLANADATSVIRAGAQPPVTGRLSSKFDVEGIGSNPAALVGSLNGSGSVTLEGVQIAGIDPKGIDTAVRLFERGTSITPARIGDIVGRAMDAGSMSVPWVSVPLAISAGRVRLGKLAAPPQSNDLAVSGTLDLVDATLDARVTVFGAAAAGQRPEASILLKGPLAAPRRSVDVSALVSWLTMQSIDREAKRLDAAERAAKQIEAAAPESREAMPGQRETPIGTNVGANLSAPAAQPPAAPALPPPVTLSRPPGAMTPRALPRVQTAPPLLTPQ